MVNQSTTIPVHRADPAWDFALFFPEFVATRHRGLYDRLDQRVMSDRDVLYSHVKSLEAITGHHSFLDEGLGGRGQAYRDGQQREPLARRVGYQYFFDKIAQHRREVALNRRFVNDALGGSGTLCRAASFMLPFDQRPYWITSDPNPAQIVAALNAHLPAAPQAAQRTLFRDNVVDHAIFAYGTHHIPRAERQTAFNEAYRYLSPGGQIIVQDFEEYSPTARWYSEALHVHTTTGHACDHFSATELKGYLRDAGFDDVRVEYQYDPFVFEGEDPLPLRGRLLEHLVSMFGMVKLARTADESAAAYHDRLDAILSPYAKFTSRDVSFYPDAVPCFTLSQVKPGKWRAEYPRVAIVALGTKPK